MKLLSVKEIGATKAYTLGRRATLKDYIDLYFILRERYTSLSQLITIAQQKYQRHFDARLFLERLLSLEDVPDEEIIFLKQKATKAQMRKFFIQRIKGLKL